MWALMMVFIFADGTSVTAVSTPDNLMPTEQACIAKAEEMVAGVLAQHEGKGPPPSHRFRCTDVTPGQDA